MGRKRIHVTAEALRKARREANQQYRARLRAANPRPPAPSPAERFWTKVVKGDGCWLWSGATNEFGYGMFRFRERMRLAHRVAWELTYGSEPSGFACHTCDNPPCVRPDHLFEGGQRENMADAAAKGRTARPSTPKRPRQRSGNYARRPGELSAIARLRWMDVRDIRRRYALGEGQTALGLAFGVSHSNVWQIVHGRTWIE